MYYSYESQKRSDEGEVSILQHPVHHDSSLPSEFLVRVSRVFQGERKPILVESNEWDWSGMTSPSYTIHENNSIDILLEYILAKNLRSRCDENYIRNMGSLLLQVPLLKRNQFSERFAVTQITRRDQDPPVRPGITRLFLRRLLAGSENRRKYAPDREPEYHWGLFQGPPETRHPCSQL